MAAVMGGKEGEAFKRFERLCREAYMCLRRHGNTLINLFLLMVPAGMPELSTVDEIQYLRDMLMIGVDDDKAWKTFHAEMESALKNWFRRFDNTIHIMVHN